MTTQISARDNTETGYAKINLALHVRRRLPNGYHDIETIFAFLDRGDAINVCEFDDLKLSIIGPFSTNLSESDNIVIEAAHLLAEEVGETATAHITLDKQLPVASGIGGGSADAAAALRLLNKFWNAGYSLSELAKLSQPLGADVPACVLSQTAIGRGIGHQLQILDDASLDGKFAMLVNPLIGISTADVFKSWGGIDRGCLPDDDVMEIATRGRNDLQQPAEQLVPVIGEIIDALRNTDTGIARMSGSGATCFSLYNERKQAEMARNNILQSFPHAWTMIGQLR